MVIYVDGLYEPTLLSEREYRRTGAAAPGVTTLQLPTSALIPINDYFGRNPGAAVWLVPSQPCPECATRRNLADSPGA